MCVHEKTFRNTTGSPGVVGGAVCVLTAAFTAVDLHNSSFVIQNSSSLIQNSSFLTQNSSSLMQSSLLFSHRLGELVDKTSGAER